jgi:Divergent InlB B-repeat domain/Viral BACON domain
MRTASRPINFNNTTNGQGNTTRVATLTVNAPPLLQVTPATNIVASGTQGGPFTPSSFQYQVSASAGSVNYSISGLPNWLAASSISGTASPSASTETFTVNANASGLAPNTYIATITFTNSDTGQGTQTRTATLTVNAPVLQVTPTANIVAAGNQGALPASSFPYALSANAGIVNYSISGVPNWLTTSSTSGNASSSGTTVTFAVNANANSLAPGTYGPTNITFTNSDTGQGTQTRTATLTVNPPALLVAPTTGVSASGTHGGPFSPSSFRYTLSATFGSVKYSITTPSWLTASPTSGTVTTSAKTITFTVNSSARTLGPSTYTDNINFNNTTNNQGDTTRVATLLVNPKDYKLGVTASPVADGTVSGGGTFVEGSPTTVTAAANSGHSFVHWTQNGKVVSTSPIYTFTMPSANVTLIADFH